MNQPEPSFGPKVTFYRPENYALSIQEVVKKIGTPGLNVEFAMNGDFKKHKEVIQLDLTESHQLLLLFFGIIPEYTVGPHGKDKNRFLNTQTNQYNGQKQVKLSMVVQRQNVGGIFLAPAECLSTATFLGAFLARAYGTSTGGVLTITERFYANHNKAPHNG